MGTHYIAFISSTEPEVRKPFLKRPDRKYYELVATAYDSSTQSDAVAQTHSLTIYKRVSVPDPIKNYYYSKKLAHNSGFSDPFITTMGT